MSRRGFKRKQGDQGHPFERRQPQPPQHYPNRQAGYSHPDHQNGYNHGYNNHPQWIRPTVPPPMPPPMPMHLRNHYQPPMEPPLPPAFGPLLGGTSGYAPRPTFAPQSASSAMPVQHPYAQNSWREPVLSSSYPQSLPPTFSRQNSGPIIINDNNDSDIEIIGESNNGNRSREQKNGGNPRQPRAPRRPNDNSREEIVLDNEEINGSDPVRSRLNKMLGLKEGEVPAYVMRMRERGLTGYPPAYLDQYVRVSSAIPLFSDSVEDIFPRRTVIKDKLPAYVGYTHSDGDLVSDNLCQALQNLADEDYALTTVRFKSDSEQYALCQSTEFVKEKLEGYSRTEIPEHTPDGDGGYAFAKETRHLKHDINNFAKDIQPFEHRELTPKTGFLKKLTSILKRKPKKNGDEKNDEIRL